MPSMASIRSMLGRLDAMSGIVIDAMSGVKTNLAKHRVVLQSITQVRLFQASHSLLRVVNRHLKDDMPKLPLYLL